MPFIILQDLEAYQASFKYMLMVKIADWQEAKALDIEISHEGEGTEGKCRKDKGHDLRCRPGPSTELRLVHMHHVSYSIYCNDFKNWVNTKCSRLRYDLRLILIVGVHSERELLIILMADCRVKFMSNLIRCRWFLLSATRRHVFCQLRL